jgi:hypothetical protein
MKNVVRYLACVALAFASPATAANVLSNAGFESGSLSPWFQDHSFSSGTDWFVTNADSHSGTYSAEDTGNKELRQNFAGIAGSSITQFSFWAEHPVEGTASLLAYDFFYSDSTSAEFLVDTVGTGWTLFDVLANLNTSKTLVGFSIYGNSYPGDITRVDDFVINVGGAVPEPASWAMMLLGFAAIGMAVRRRRGAEALA